MARSDQRVQGHGAANAAQLLTASLKKRGVEQGVCILVATSGDTGKAALEGFADVPGTRIMVFYPEGGVSDVQRLQMVTQRGGKTSASAPSRATLTTLRAA